MQRLVIFSLLALLVLFVTSCDSNLVARSDYEAELARADSLEARCDELEFEMMDLKLYNDYLETTIDSLTAAVDQR